MLNQEESWIQQQHMRLQHANAAAEEEEDGSPVYLQDFLQGEPSPEVRPALQMTHHHCHGHI
jgi:hypothetical protein